MKHYYIYILTNKMSTVLYTGITNNLLRRVYEHRNGLIDGFTKKYKVIKLVYFEDFTNPTDAIAAEKKIKGWIRKKKIKLIESVNPKWNDLFPQLEGFFFGGTKNDIKKYYSKRASEYEKVYHREDSNRQNELRKISKALQSAMSEKNVIELACGTGYWTQLLSRTAKSVYATDIVEEALEIAKTKKYVCPIQFSIEDAYRLSFSDGTFDGGLANFWFSHIPKSKINTFLKEFHRVLKKGSSVFITDNVLVKSIGGKLVKKPNDENTYKLRKLKDGEQFLVLKNYYSKENLLNIFKKHVKNFSPKNIFYGKNFWHITYTIN